MKTLALSLPDELKPATDIWTADEARSLCTWVFQDSRCSSEEKSLLLSLAKPSKVELSFASGQTQMMSPATAKSLELFRLVTEKKDLNALWAGDAAEFEEIMELYQIIPKSRKNINDAVTRRIFKKWEESNSANEYAPIRAEVKRALDLSRGKPYEMEVRELLYNACRRVDDYLKGAVPNYIFDSLKPQ